MANNFIHNVGATIPADIASTIRSLNEELGPDLAIGINFIDSKASSFVEDVIKYMLSYTVEMHDFSTSVIVSNPDTDSIHTTHANDHVYISEETVKMYDSILIDTYATLSIKPQKKETI